MTEIQNQSNCQLTYRANNNKERQWQNTASMEGMQMRHTWLNATFLPWKDPEAPPSASYWARLLEPRRGLRQRPIEDMHMCMWKRTRYACAKFAWIALHMQMCMYMKHVRQITPRHCLRVVAKTLPPIRVQKARRKKTRPKRLSNHINMWCRQSINDKVHEIKSCIDKPSWCISTCVCIYV